MGISLVKKVKILLSILPSVILLDQLTKQIIISKFYLGESISIIPGLFNFTYVRNTGAAFGILSSADPSFRVPFFLIIPGIAIGIIIYLFKKLEPGHTFLATALSLILSGAIGNLIDRVVYRYVIDFLDFHWKEIYHFPAFNIADSAITVGVAFMILDMFFPYQTNNKEK